MNQFVKYDCFLFVSAFWFQLPAVWFANEDSCFPTAPICKYICSTRNSRSNPLFVFCFEKRWNFQQRTSPGTTTSYLTCLWSKLQNGSVRKYWFTMMAHINLYAPLDDDDDDGIKMTRVARLPTGPRWTSSTIGVPLTVTYYVTNCRLDFFNTGKSFFLCSSSSTYQGVVHGPLIALLPWSAKNNIKINWFATMVNILF